MKLEYKIRPSIVEDGPIPALFMLHGYGADMNDLFGLSNQIPAEFAVISLQAPRRLPWGGYSWYAISPDPSGGLQSNVEEAKQSMVWVSENVKALIQEMGLDQNRLFFMGFSQGTILSLALGAEGVLQPTGILALSGYLNLDFCTSKAGEISMGGTAIFQSHGTEDAVIPLSKAEETRDLLEMLDMDYTFKTYSAGHGIHPDNWLDALRWLKNH